MPDYSLYMGITGNIIDMEFNELLDLSNVVSEWATQCVDAYNLNQTSCPFAKDSMDKLDPTADILSRINAIQNALSQRQLSNSTSILTYSNSLPFSLDNPNGWANLASTFATMEQQIANDYTVPPSPQESQPDQTPVYNDNLTLYSYEVLGDPPYANNYFQYYFIVCADGSLEEISTLSQFANYVEGQISQDATRAYANVEDSVCVNWPNLTGYNVENYRSAFPSSINNKILMIGETLNSLESYEGGFATYEYVGGQNAVWLIHDAIGDGIYSDPNNCTNDAIRQFYLTGTFNSL